LPGETILTFGVRQGCGFITLSSHALTDRETHGLVLHLLELARRVNGNLALDATLVRPFHCHWINSLISLHHKCRGMGGQLVLLGLPEDAHDIITSTGLTKLLKVTTSRSQAIDIFHNTRPATSLFSRLLPKRRAA